MIVMQPVLETRAPESFGLWPVAEIGPAGFLPLRRGLSPAEVGAAVMLIASWNSIDPDDEPGAAARPGRPIRSVPSCTGC